MDRLPSELKHKVLAYAAYTSIGALLSLSSTTRQFRDIYTHSHEVSPRILSSTIKKVQPFLATALYLAHKQQNPGPDSDEKLIDIFNKVRIKDLSMNDLENAAAQHEVIKSVADFFFTTPNNILAFIPDDGIADFHTELLVEKGIGAVLAGIYSFAVIRSASGHFLDCATSSPRSDVYVDLDGSWIAGSKPSLRTDKAKLRYKWAASRLFSLLLGLWDQSDHNTEGFFTAQHRAILRSWRRTKCSMVLKSNDGWRKLCILMGVVTLEERQKLLRSWEWDEQARSRFEALA